MFCLFGLFVLLGLIVGLYWCLLLVIVIFFGSILVLYLFGFALWLFCFMFVFSLVGFRLLLLVEFCLVLTVAEAFDLIVVFMIMDCRLT